MSGQYIYVFNRYSSRQCYVNIFIYSTDIVPDNVRSIYLYILEIVPDNVMSIYLYIQQI